MKKYLLVLLTFFSLNTFANVLHVSEGYFEIIFRSSDQSILNTTAAEEGFYLIGNESSWTQNILMDINVPPYRTIFKKVSINHNNFKSVVGEIINSTYREEFLKYFPAAKVVNTRMDFSAVKCSAEKCTANYTMEVNYRVH
ncbi:MAG: hypothetical protein AB7I27_04235 [Bacteriovoracaceae bacterium]